MAFARAQTDIILLDIQFSDGNSIAFCMKTKQEYPNLHIIMRGNFDNDRMILDSLKAGAHGYIDATEGIDQIEAAILEVRRGGTPISMGIARSIIEHFHQLELKKNGPDILTAKEQEILKLLAKGLMYKEIACILEIQLDTVKKHCGNMYKKLQVSNRTEALIKMHQTK